MEAANSKCDECGKLTPFIHYVTTLGNVLSPNKLCGDCYQHYTSKQSVVTAPQFSFNDCTFDQVNHPNHYGGDSTYEVIKVLKAWGLEKNALLWNVVKYVARFDKKSTDPKKHLEDLEKARFYLDQEINNRKGELSGK